MKGVAGRCLVTMGGRGWGEGRCVVWEGVCGRGRGVVRRGGGLD